MAWNEPGGNNRDPWGGGGRDQGPPDLDEVIRKISGKFGKILGDKGPNNRFGGGRGSSAGLWIIAAVALAIWLLSGFYIVDEGKEGVELRFGRYANTTNPGLNYHLPYPIETVEIVDVQQLRAIELGYRTEPNVRAVRQEALMLTKDENMVDVRLAVQYRVDNARNFLFAVRQPEDTLRQVVESVTREEVGGHIMDYLLTEGRSDIVASIREQSQEVLNSYDVGLLITNVNLQDAQPPEEVQDAFADAIKAREDEQRLINEAETYSNRIVPQARGAAARQLEEAEAYRNQVIARAEGEASRFSNLLTEYAKAPEVTRERIYLDTIEEVLANSGKVIVDVQGGNNLLYLPMDQLMRRAGAQQNDNGANGPSSDSLTSQIPSLPRRQENVNFPFRDTDRRREVR